MIGGGRLGCVFLSLHVVTLSLQHILPQRASVSFFVFFFLFGWACRPPQIQAKGNLPGLDFNGGKYTRTCGNLLTQPFGSPMIGWGTGVILLLGLYPKGNSHSLPGIFQVVGMEHGVIIGTLG